MSDQLQTLLSEERRFPPDPAFAAAAVTTEATYDQAAADRLGFWEAEAKRLDWFTPWHSVLEWKLPHAKWFSGGRLNVAVNCVDRHLTGARRNQAGNASGGRASP